MSFALWIPLKPVVPMGSYTSDEERLIERKCFDLVAIQQALLVGSLFIELTSTAAMDASKMGWRLRDVSNFLGCLERRHYKNSQWCLPPADGNQFEALPADAYLMGFNKMKVQENPRFEPHIYIKFAVREAVRQVLVFSLHASTR